MRHNRAATMVLHMKEGREWRDRCASSVILYLATWAPIFSNVGPFPLPLFLSFLHLPPPSILLSSVFFNFSCPSLFTTPIPSLSSRVYAASFIFFFVSLPVLIFQLSPTRRPIVSWKCAREATLERERGETLKINSFRNTRLRPFKSYPLSLSLCCSNFRPFARRSSLPPFFPTFSFRFVLFYYYLFSLLFEILSSISYLPNFFIPFCHPLFSLIFYLLLFLFFLQFSPKKKKTCLRPFRI